MLFQYCSDLHLEFPENKSFLKMRPIVPRSPVLLLAGDIVPFQHLDKHGDFFDFVSANFEQTYWVPGNHEYYRSDAVYRSGTFCEKIRSNITLLNNKIVEEGGVSIIFSTLWSLIGPRHQYIIQRSLSDYSAIQFEGRPILPCRTNQFHSEAVAFIREALAEVSDTKPLVVTHHVPTFLHYPAMYEESELNEAFGTELFDLIHESGAACWIFGHHHSNVDDFKIGHTLMTTNQLGYVRLNEQKGFQAHKVVEVC